MMNVIEQVLVLSSALLTVGMAVIWAKEVFFEE